MSETSDLARPAHPSFWEAFVYWLKLGFISFGGPAGQISIMHQELVEKHRFLRLTCFTKKELFQI